MTKPSEAEQIRRAAQQFPDAVEVVHDGPARQPYVPLPRVEPTGEGTGTPDPIDAAAGAWAHLPPPWDGLPEVEAAAMRAVEWEVRLHRIDVDDIRDITAVVRPLIYREVADRLPQPADDVRSGMLDARRLITEWADEMGDDRG